MGIVGQIVVWPIDRTPQNWLPCDGTAYQDTEYLELWSVIATIYGGGPGRGAGRVPGFRSRRAIGAGQVPGLPAYELGASGDDATAAASGLGFLGLPSIILTKGTLPPDVNSGMLGAILPYAGEEIPSNYGRCDGTLLLIGDYQELFSILGPRFGGDGRDNFALPDLRGRAPLGTDATHRTGEAGEDHSAVGTYGHQAINYVMPLRPPAPGGGGGDDPLIGEIIYTGAEFAPRGWDFCRGQLLPIAQYVPLFSLIGTTFGGDGRATFALPDLRGRVVVDSGSLGATGALSSGGDSPVAYLGVEPIIALEGIYPSFG